MASFSMYSDEQDEWGYAAETTFGTALADNTNFKKIKFPKGTRVELPIINTDMESNRAARQLDTGDIHTDNFTGPVRITVPEVMLHKTILADMIYACLQNKVSEGGATVYLKSFKCHLSQPDFTANAGFFFTLAWKGPVTAKHIKFTSCIVKSMEIVFDKSGTGANQLVKIRNLEIVGQTYTLACTLSGTWSAYTTTFNSYDYTLKYDDSTSMEWLRCSIKLDNGAEVLDRTAAGLPKTFFLNWSHNMIAEVAHWYNANTTGTIADLMALYAAGTLFRLSIGSSATNSQDGHFKLTFYGRINTSPYGAENKQLITPYTMQLAHASTTTNDLIIVAVADSVDQTP
jgi:hypothetical protein